MVPDPPSRHTSPGVTRGGTGCPAVVPAGVHPGRRPKRRLEEGGFYDREVYDDGRSRRVVDEYR
jgi:hypothetical protein